MDALLQRSTLTWEELLPMAADIESAANDADERGDWALAIDLRHLHDGVLRIAHDRAGLP